ncbi:uncharacterized protein AFUA_8G02080 [Aspergillus fumigatus Af293]|uniref:Uncharacterized protein n=2 Tax=Aspergillus fumigatus TaxID=746128 RepID=Q4WBF2_ASPFU|nr:conserved hypothetical protein [Aspergillus fumigatus Af293]EAL84960.1 conserved hypothetical protein [Aspergillus fumigatus Af293]EDP49002.1 hypothetical protein AFUB_084530 [Aspergillus fumigatus A1163]
MTELGVWTVQLNKDSDQRQGL